VATDLLAGTELRLSSGPALPALLASAAIPGIFPAQRIGDRHVIDGGVANHTPVSAAIDLGATRLVVLPTGYSCALAEPPKRAIATALHGLNILIARQLTHAVQRYRSHVEILVVPPLCPLNVLPYDFASCGTLIDRAMASTAQWLDHGVELVEGVPHQLPPHSHHDHAHPYGPHRLA
jgi:NTE family protein